MAALPPEKEHPVLIRQKVRWGPESGYHDEKKNHCPYWESREEYLYLRGIK
jgi:hypothetical protein